MSPFRIRIVLFLLIAIVLVPDSVKAMGGTDIIARPGKPVSKEVVQAFKWPAGTWEILNDSKRTTGWRSWVNEFTGPSTYGYAVKTQAEAQSLIDRFARIQSDRLIIRLAPGDGARVPGISKTETACVTFSIGDQKATNRAFKRIQEVKLQNRLDGLSEPGDRLIEKLSFIVDTQKLPAALPPTLTLYINNELLKLDEFRIPPSIQIDTQRGLENGWKWDKDRQQWSPTPEEIRAFIEKHRAQKKTP